MFSLSRDRHSFSYFSPSAHLVWNRKENSQADMLSVSSLQRKFFGGFFSHEFARQFEWKIAKLTVLLTSVRLSLVYLGRLAQIRIFFVNGNLVSTSVYDFLPAICLLQSGPKKSEILQKCNVAEHTFILVKESQLLSWVGVIVSRRHFLRGTSWCF